MADITPELKAAAKAHLAAIKVSLEFRLLNPTHFVILDDLFNRWTVGQKEYPSAKEVAAATRWALDLQPEAKVRQAFKQLRKQLDAFNAREGARSFVRFEIPVLERTYRLDVIPTVPKEDMVRILLNHRTKHSENLKSLLCANADSILFVAFSPAQVLINHVAPWLRSGEIVAPEFRILTWAPEPAMVKAMADHIGGDPDVIGSRISEGLVTATNLATAYPSKVQLRHYRTIPTALGVCNGEYMTVESIPFNRSGPLFHECGALENRSALFLHYEKNAPSFRYFQSWFEDLWTASGT